MSRSEDVHDGGRAILRKLIVTNYDILARRLAGRVGSIEGAHEVLQETYLRLDRIAVNGELRSPNSYLFRIAMNIAIDMKRAENRRLSSNDIDDLLAIPDDRPGPLKIAEDRSEIELLKKALAELPERRRDIFTASRISGAAHADLAKKYGVTVRTIQLEIKAALEYCAIRLQRGVE